MEKLILLGDKKMPTATENRTVHKIQIAPDAFLVSKELHDNVLSNSEQKVLNPFAHLYGVKLYISKFLPCEVKLAAQLSQ